MPVLRGNDGFCILYSKLSALLLRGVERATTMSEAVNSRVGQIKGKLKHGRFHSACVTAQD